MRPYGSGPGYGGFGFGRTLTPAVKQLIIANFVVFFVQAFAFDPMVRLFAFIPREAVVGLQVWRFVTYMFLHGGFTHILFNMFGLWMFGTQIERLWGYRTFLIYYFVCGLGGAATYGLFNLAGVGAYVPMLGASGAIYGILLAFALFFPDAVILIFMVIPMKAKYAVLLFGLIELLSVPKGGEVAHLAHLGGMLAGFLFIYGTIPAMRRTGSGLDAFVRRARARMKGFRTVPPRKPGNGKDPDPDQAEIDRILDKISRHGLQSLDEREQEILRRAGRR